MARKKPRDVDDDQAPGWVRDGSNAPDAEQSETEPNRCSWKTDRGYRCLYPAEIGTKHALCGYHHQVRGKAYRMSREGLGEYVDALNVGTRRKDDTTVGYCCGWTHHSIGYLWQIVCGEHPAPEEARPCTSPCCPWLYCQQGICDHAEHAGRMTATARYPAQPLVRETAEGLPLVASTAASPPERSGGRA